MAGRRAPGRARIRKGPGPLDFRIGGVYRPVIGGGEVGQMRRIVVVLGIVVAEMALAGQGAWATGVTVAAAGDIARPSLATPQQQTADLVTAFDPTAVFALGDEQYDKGELANFQKYYDPSWGAFKARTYPVPGNHEYKTAGAAGYYVYFGGGAGDPAKGYYSFDLGGWHVLALNTNCAYIDCTTEKAWVKGDLAADTHTCELAFYHHTNLAWPQKLMKAAGGDVVLAGHRHTYERWAPVGGVVRFTVGTGGDSLGSPDPGAAAGVSAYGILELTLDASSYSWSFVDVSGAVRDSGSADCHG